MNCYHRIEDNTFLFNVRTEEILVFYAIKTYSTSELLRTSIRGFPHFVLARHSSSSFGSQRVRSWGPSSRNENETPLKRGSPPKWAARPSYATKEIARSDTRYGYKIFLAPLLCTSFFYLLFSVLVYSNWRQMRHSTLYNF